MDTRTKGWGEAGRNRDGASISLLNIKIYRLRPSGFQPLARAIVPSGTARKASGDLRRLRPVGQTSAGLLVVLAFRRLLAGGRKLCLQHNFRGVRSSENIGFLGDLPRSLRRGAVGMLRTPSTRSPVCPAGRSRRRSHDAFRPGIHYLATNTPICSNSIFVPISRSIIPPASSAFD